MGGGEKGDKPYEKIEVPKETPKHPGFQDHNGKFLIGKEALELCKHFEGLYLKAYRDPVGVVTIGYGRIINSDGSKVRMGQTCTEAEAEEWLLDDLFEEGAKYVRAFTEDSVEAELSADQFSALVDLTFNRGAGRFRDFVAVHLNKRDFTNALVALTSLNWAISNGARKYLLGLDRRRWAEALLWRGDDWRKVDTVAKFQEFKNRGYR